MDRVTLLFWTVISLLLGSSAYYGISAARMSHHYNQAAGSVANGDLVHLIKVIDGDTIQAAKEGLDPVTIRLVGIKAFESKIDKDALSPYAQASVEQLGKLLGNKPLRVMLNSATPKDNHDRYLATLYVEDQDVALELIRQGLVLVYTVYPIPALPIYLQEQSRARGASHGVWANAAAAKRAQALMAEWRGQSE